MPFLEVYKEKCGQICCEPIASLVETSHSNDTERVIKLGSNQARKKQLSLLQLTALCEALASDTHVEYCDFSYCDSTPVSQLHDPTAATFGTAGAEIVARLMRSNCTIRYIILEGNAICSQGAKVLAETLSKDEGASVYALNLARNPIGDDGASAFASMLQQNETLKMLDLGGCDIKVHGLLAITAALTEHNSTLESMGLEDCQIQSPPQMDTTRYLARMFAQNTGLKQIFLSKHSLHDWDFEMLVEYGLSKNSTLEVLDLHANRLSGMCAMSLARLLQENQRIQVLNLANNRVSDECIVALAESLPHNSVLEELDVRCCGVSEAGIEILSRAAMASQTLRQVFIWGNDCGPAAAAAWRDLCMAKAHTNGGPSFVTDAEPYEVDGVPMLAIANEDDDPQM